MPLKIVTRELLSLAHSFNEFDFTRNEDVLKYADPMIVSMAEMIRRPDSGKLIISLDELLQGKLDFYNRYKKINNTPFLNEFVINWQAFKQEIENNCSYNENDILLNFIHRYDSDNSRWYLTVQCCQIEAKPEINPPTSVVIGDNLYYVYKILNRGYMFDIKYGQIVTPSTLSPGADYDPVYFQQVKESGNALNPNTHVRSIYLPWKAELIKLYTENGLQGKPNIQIKFVSCTSDYGTGTLSSLVQWPHGVAICMVDAGNDCLNNNQEITIFKNKACDYGSLCPPRCDNYYWPDYLPR